MKNTSEVEVQNISNNGIWLYVNGNEFFLSYMEYPWFKEAKAKEIYNFELLLDKHLHWPDLDIDLEIDSLYNPEKYPLVYK
ncbi:MAG: DUF2442 domain-containing protein [Candidatus Cloacimonetes bacterium]|nr:DUF2442 domain-containing protein [Candidatus Cloacimonadota bacterium]